MNEPWAVLALFPENGLDRSLHAPVFIGLLFLVFFREAFGWGFAGLVVPGYLATVLLAAPVTAGLVIFEAIATYLAALLLGRVLPRTGAWFTFFGRERFLLLIAAASLVRLSVEGSLLPAIVGGLSLTHSRELYSLGLVLVPLLANSFWNAGFVRAFPRICLVTTLTYLIVAEVLLPYTNFTLSRFQVANESVSLAFLESPHAHIILLVGAILGARNNVRYGWDYNGILVPALLAVAWYQPTKVGTTLLEGLLVYYTSMWLIRRRPFSRMMFVGCRRVVLTFSVGFAIKYLSGTLLARWLPHVQLIDFFGFGYLLPSLLANKMWDKGGVPKVLMPTLQVSILAFPIGTLLGFGLRSLEEPRAEIASAPIATVAETSSVPLALLLGDTAPAPDRSGTSFKLSDSHAIALEIVRSSSSPELTRELLELAARGRLRVEQPRDREWTVLTPDPLDPNLDSPGPRVAFRSHQRYGDDWLVVVEAPAVGSAAVPAAFAVAQRIGARALVLQSRLDTLAVRDARFADELRRALDLQHTLRVSLAGSAPRITLGAVGRLPLGFTTQLLEDVLGAPVALDWLPERAQTAGLGSLDSDTKTEVLALRVPDGHAQRVGANVLGDAPLEHWTLNGQAELSARITELSHSSPADFREPSISELRLYGALLEQRLREHSQPSAWQRAIAAGLGLRFAQIQGYFAGFALFESTGPKRRGSPTWIERKNSPGNGPRLALTLAAPRWEWATTDAAARLYDAFDASALLVHGALVNVSSDGRSDPRRPQGKQSFFQRAHEAWLNGGGTSVMLRGMSATQAATTDVVVTFDSEVQDITNGPTWALPLLSRLTEVGVSVAALDGSAERAAFAASVDPGVAYARRFAPQRSFVLWLGAELREAWRRGRTDGITRRRLDAAAVVISELRPEELLDALARCAGSDADASCARAEASASCQRAALRDQLERYVASRNPYYLEASLAQAEACGLVASESPPTGTTWLLFPPDRAPPPGRPREHWLALPLLGSGEGPDAKGVEMRSIDRGQFGVLSRIALGPLEVRL